MSHATAGLAMSTMRLMEMTATYAQYWGVVFFLSGHSAKRDV